MLFNSIPFLILVAVTVIAVMVARSREQQMIVLLISSYLFYAYWDVRYLLLMLFVEYVSYVFARIVEARRNRYLFALGIALPIAILLIFKYSGFIGNNFSLFFTGEKVDNLRSYALPIGISFYTFQSLSYLIDVWRGEIKARKRFLEVSLYISFFPQLVAGPIMRAKDFLPQLENKIKITGANISEGVQIFTWGLFKKIVIADRLAVCVDSVFMAPKAYSGLSLVMAAISYALQILCDFSGYSDMAVGTAKVFGFDLCRNFDLPYLSQNPSEFWRRWHISLSNWLRDYLYIPLGGNRKGITRTYINLMVTMLLGGLWHGASWNFVIWGGLHGLALVIHRLYRGFIINRIPGIRNSALYSALCTVVNNVFVICCWVVFRLESFSDIKDFFSGIITWQKGIDYIYVYTVVFVILTLIYYIYSKKRKNSHAWDCILELTNPKQLFMFSFFIWMIILFGYLGNNAFIYFQF